MNPGLLIALAGILAACGGGSKGGGGSVPATPGENEDTGETGPSCEVAEALEVEAWVAEMVTDPGDELEIFTALGMILTLTDPSILEEMRSANPEFATATAASAVAWNACGQTSAVNCAALAEAMAATEARLDSDIWTEAPVDARCRARELSLENADCALAASDADTAKGCF